jgi:hypothetical protein
MTHDILLSSILYKSNFKEFFVLLLWRNRKWREIVCIELLLLLLLCLLYRLQVKAWLKRFKYRVTQSLSIQHNAIFSRLSSKSGFKWHRREPFFSMRSTIKTLFFLHSSSHSLEHTTTWTLKACFLCSLV